ncbi:MAG: T9SS type A sorting domain-containing protein [Alphaproteobacteria bacterium]|nr:T9SS type A sorting domain-containing protein [Alphaproteobacteria bacterium]
MKKDRIVANRVFGYFPGIILGMLVFLAIMMVNTPVSAQVTAVPERSSGKMNFYDIQKSFNDYWKGRTVTKGSGYKIFRRWEWYWEQRVGRSGEFPSNDVIMKGWENYVAENNYDHAVDTAGNWKPLGPYTPISGYSGLGRINCIAFHPNNKDIFWVGSPSGGIWKTTDFGQNWVNLGGQLPIFGVSDIAVDPNNPSIIYVATGDGDDGSFSNVNGTNSGDTKSLGVWKSVDGGLTWNATALNWMPDSNFLIRRLIMHPLNSTILYAATTNGIYMITEGGAKAERQISGYFKDIVFCPNDPATLYAATQGDGKATDGQIFRTTNGGISWIQRTNFSKTVRIKIAVSPQNPLLVEALCSGRGRGLHGVYRSTDGGETFSLYLSVAPNCSNNYLHALREPAKDSIDPCGGQGEYDLCYLINPSNINERWIGGVNTWKSTDGGVNWKMKTYWCNEEPGFAEVHADKHWFAYHPLLPGIFFEGNDGGISYTTDGGNNWTDISKGLQIGQIYKIANAYTDPKIIMGGFQDNGSQIYNNGHWIAPVDIGGDGMNCLIDNYNANIKYAAYLDGVIKRTKSPIWSSVTTISAKIPGGQPAGAWVTPYILHPKDTAVLYAGYKMHLYKATKRGDAWEKIFTQPSPVSKYDSLFRVITISDSDPKVMYASTGYRMFRTKDEWKTFDTIALPLEFNMLTGIAVHTKNPNTVYISFSGYTSGKKVFKSTNGGISWDTISQNLPNVSVNCIVFQDSSNEGLYIGTDLGVYFRNNQMTSWKRFSSGLPNVMVTDLKIQYMNGKIRAATYGRGLWESDLYVASGTYQVRAVDIPIVGGDVEGDGVFNPGGKAHMIARSEPGWKFTGWYENDAKISDSLNYSFTVNENHNLVGMFEETTGVNESKLKSRVHLFPNPTQGIIEIQIDKEISGDLQKVMVANMEGKSVFESTAKITKEHFTIDLSSGSNGKYLVTLYFKSGEKVSNTIILNR